MSLRDKQARQAGRHLPLWVQIILPDAVHWPFLFRPAGQREGAPIAGSALYFASLRQAALRHRLQRPCGRGNWRASQQGQI